MMNGREGGRAGSGKGLGGRLGRSSRHLFSNATEIFIEMIMYLNLTLHTSPEQRINLLHFKLWSIRKLTAYSGLYENNFSGFLKIRINSIFNYLLAQKFFISLFFKTLFKISIYKTMMNKIKEKQNTWRDSP